MTTCAACGHELGAGRYCVNCGHPVAGWRTDTAERASVPPAPRPPAPAEAPPAWTPPPPARFPLFADEVDDAPTEPGAEPGAEQGAEQGAEPAPAYPSAHETTRHRRGRPWAVWVLVATVLVLVAVIGVVLLTRSDDPASGRDRTPSGSGGAPSDPPSDSPSEPADTTTPLTGEVADEATVEVPATAPPGTDLSGEPVDYAAENMLDGRLGTTWRMAGDGSGATITITLPQQTALDQVGLVNGYAKTAGSGKGRRDWYHGNRRVQRVEWTFDDGTTVRQRLGDSREMQTVDVDTTTTTIKLRLVAVSAPGTGPARRDFTAISELSLRAG